MTKEITGILLAGRYYTQEDTNLLGVLRDGFTKYGRKDNDDTYPSSLDKYCGHTGYYIIKAGRSNGSRGTISN